MTKADGQFTSKSKVQLQAGSVDKYSAAAGITDILQLVVNTSIAIPHQSENANQQARGRVQALTTTYSQDIPRRVLGIHSTPSIIASTTFVSTTISLHLQQSPL